MSEDIKITDGAEEIARLWGNISRLRGSKDIKTSEALATYIKVQPDDLIFGELLGVLSGRLSQLRQLIVTTKHPDVGDTYRAQLAHCIDALGSWVVPANMNRGWSYTKEKVHQSDIGLIASFGHVARAHRPLKLITDEEKKEVERQIREVLEELENENALVPWASHMLRSSLTQTLVILKYLPVFGHEILVDGLGDLKEKTRFLQMEVEKSGDLVATSQGRASLLKTANAVMFALNLVAVPPQAEEYTWWYANKALGLYENFLSIEHKDENSDAKTALALPPGKKEDTDEESQ